MKKETKKDKKKRLQTVADTLQAEVARYRLVRQEWEARYHRLEASAAAASPHRPPPRKPVRPRYGCNGDFWRLAQPCNKADLQQLVPEHSDNHLRDEEVWDSLEAELDLETELDLIMQRELAAPESEAKPVCRTTSSLGAPRRDRGLQLRALRERYRGAFQKNVWLLLPLDPAALEELSVTYMFETKEGAEDMSPFALAVNMVMAIGARTVGHMGPAKEFFMRARAIGSTFFDVTDYSVAEGLLALAYFCTGAENVSTMIYYLTLAHRMLVALNQTRSPIYLRTTIALAGGERRDIKRRAKLLEDYFNTSSLAYTVPIPESSSSPTTPFNYSHLATVDSLARIFLSVNAGIDLYMTACAPSTGTTPGTGEDALLRPKKEKASPGMYDSEPPSVEQVARENLLRLIKVLERAQAEMEACPQADAALNEPEEAIVRQASLLLPRRYHHQHFGALLSLKAKCHLLLGMHQLAFDSARTVSALMREQSSIFQCMQPYFLPMLAYLLEVLQMGCSAEEAEVRGQCMQDWDFLHHTLMPGLKRKYGDAGEPGKLVEAAQQPPPSPLSPPRLSECEPAVATTGQLPHHEPQTEMPSWGAEVIGLRGHALPPPPETTGYQTAERVWQYLHNDPPTLGPMPVATTQLAPQSPSYPPALHRSTASATSSGLPAISLLDDEALPLPPPSGGFPLASGEAAAPTPSARKPFAGHPQPQPQEAHHTTQTASARPALEAFRSYGQSYPRTTPEYSLTPSPITPLPDRPSFINIYNYTNIFITSPAAAPSQVPAASSSTFSSSASFVNPIPPPPPGSTAAHPTSHMWRM